MEVRQDKSPKWEYWHFFLFFYLLCLFNTIFQIYIYFYLISQYLIWNIPHIHHGLGFNLNYKNKKIVLQNTTHYHPLIYLRVFHFWFFIITLQNPPFCQKRTKGCYHTQDHWFFDICHTIGSELGYSGYFRAMCVWLSLMYLTTGCFLFGSLRAQLDFRSLCKLTKSNMENSFLPSW